VETAEILLSEYGSNFNEFPSEASLSSTCIWRRDNRSLAGSRSAREREERRDADRAGLKDGRYVLPTQPTALGAYYRKVAAHKDAATAIFATARKMAQCVYRLFHYGQAYVDEGTVAFEKRFEALRFHRIAATADQLGNKLVPKIAGGVTLLTY
jgi:transposase